jgi:hypothetical protein
MPMQHGPDTNLMLLQHDTTGHAALSNFTDQHDSTGFMLMQHDTTGHAALNNFTDWYDSTGFMLKQHGPDNTYHPPDGELQHDATGHAALNDQYDSTVFMPMQHGPDNLAEFEHGVVLQHDTGSKFLVFSGRVRFGCSFFPVGATGPQNTKEEEEQDKKEKGTVESDPEEDVTR